MEYTPTVSTPNRFQVPIEALTLSLDDTLLSVVRMSTSEPLPLWVTDHQWLNVTRTHGGLSFICPSHIIPTEAMPHVTGSWQALKIHETPQPFHWVGVLATLSNIIAQAGISIFVLSTFDTDYILVKSAQAEHACGVLRQAGATIL
jgi:uncharacterized protein